MSSPSPSDKMPFGAFTEEELVELTLADEPRAPAQCKKCGKLGLQWVTYKRDGVPKWMLLEAEDGHLKRHSCFGKPFTSAPNYPLHPDLSWWDIDLAHQYIGPDLLPSEVFNNI